MERKRTTDEQLVERALDAPEGDLRAFEELVQRHTGKVVANCRYLTRAPADSEDLAQEVFVKAFFALRKFRGSSTFRTWLQRIKVNHCLDHLRRRESQAFTDIDDLQTEPSVPPEAQRWELSHDERQRIEQVLDSLSDTLRVPLIMRDMDDYSYQEIAEALGVGLSAIKMRIKRAREEFRRLYTQPVRTATGAEHAGRSH